MNELYNFLANQAYELRRLSLIQAGQAGSGHPTSCLSAADICSVLFWDTMQFDPDNYNNPLNDRFILSKGHASALLYAIWHLLGKISYEELLLYRTFNSPLEGHPTFRFDYAEAATGSLGMGISIGLGQCFVMRQHHIKSHVYVLVGDGEMSEGSNWEGIMLAGHQKINNLTIIVDANTLGQSEQSLFEQSKYHTLYNALTSFGWDVHHVDGHNIKMLSTILQKKSSKPRAIIAHTKKGNGIASIANHQEFHGKAFIDKQLATMLAELDATKPTRPSYIWQPKPYQEKTPIINTKALIHKNKPHSFETPIATRKAIGISLALIGASNKTIICLDADVKNSTYTNMFEEKFPDRFIQCYIAEQNMISIALGLEKRGKTPVVATFASFLTRAHDQIRMAAMSNSKMKIIGSHAGVSIGQDGPSQMGLEDIALFGGIPQSLILYPADGQSAQALLNLAFQYHKGISYIRTTRAETPKLYNTEHTFTIGGSQILRQSEKDQLCVVTAGITIFEALKAYELLKKEEIFITIIDAYCLKPLDAKTIINAALATQKQRIITVEDHYQTGGIGQIIALASSEHKIITCSLHIPNILPHSGTTSELLAWARIDSTAIIKTVKSLV